ncbi:DgyrCDS10880 [Dimorphilus gyrociliatus]|uniref:DNA replication complex GINS protein SLD5 n=1 Tax=Dimorphilus gyrociliatus TaxID=2664684 RepID=A0A7I8W467_9ANNE|nr:DgyrCDS10880 [Dimorphilus gyrociliatus]
MEDEEDNIFSGSDDEEAMTAGEVLQKLEEAWMNEALSPELLMNKSDIIDCMMEQINEMENNIQRVKTNDLKIYIHKMELERIRYLLTSYLRIRIKKIEKYATAIMMEDGKRDPDDAKLTDSELQFAREREKNLLELFQNLVLQHMPPNMQSLEKDKICSKPNLDEYVFFRVNQDVEGVLVEEETVDNREEVIDLKKGEQHIMRYKIIRPLAETGAVSLI